MQREMGMTTVVAISAVTVLVLGLVAWRYFGRPAVNVLDPQTQQQIDQQTAREYQQYFRTQPGGGPPGGVPMPGGAPPSGAPVPGGMPQPGGR